MGSCLSWLLSRRIYVRSAAHCSTQPFSVLLPRKATFAKLRYVVDRQLYQLRDAPKYGKQVKAFLHSDKRPHYVEHQEGLKQLSFQIIKYSFREVVPLNIGISPNFPVYFWERKAPAVGGLPRDKSSGWKGEVETHIPFAICSIEKKARNCAAFACFSVCT